MQKDDKPQSERVVVAGASFVTTDALAARAAAAWHRRHRPGTPPPPYDPDEAARAAEALARSREFRADRLLLLRDRRRITAAELRAAHEIALVAAWIAGGFAPLARTQFRERLAASTGEAEGAMWWALLEAEHTRYAPWRAWAAGFPVRPGATLDDLTRMVAVENLGVRQVARRLRMDQRRVLALLRRSLHRYACLAGWQVGENPPEEIE